MAERYKRDDTIGSQMVENGESRWLRVTKNRDQIVVLRDEEGDPVGTAENPLQVSGAFGSADSSVHVFTQDLVHGFVKVIADIAQQLAGFRVDVRVNGLF